MPVELPPMPAALPGWTVRRPGAADVDAVLALAESVDRATLAYSDWSRKDVEEAFADHWNHHPREFAPWWRAQRESGGHDLGLWWLAEVDGEPVGALIATTQMFGENALFVATLGVRRAGRGRGVGRSLLRRAFREARRRDLERVSLTVDGASPTGATALYRSEGMDVDFAMRVLRRPVGDG